MSIRSAVLSAVVVGSFVAGPALVAAPASAAPAASSATVAMRVACTRTSSGTCIRGGGFCPQSSYNRAGFDAAGRRYVCKGDRTHPHWMR